VTTLVDAAHAPGMLPVDLRALQPDYWVGNLHKWVCAPKGAAVLYAAPEVRAALLPLVTSYGYGEGFSAEFALSGTSDPTAWLAAPSSISLLGGIGWDRIRGYGQALVRYGQRVVCDAVGTEPIVPDSMTAMMTLVPMPPGVADDRAAAESVAERLWAQHRIEVPVWSWQGRGLLRLCGHVYNRAADYDHLAEVLPSLLRS
jgi:isopenicillin-N epimerase